MRDTSKRSALVKLMGLLAALSLVAAACGSDAVSDVVDSATDAAEDVADEVTGDDEEAMEDDEEAMEDDEEAMEDDAMEDDAMEDGDGGTVITGDHADAEITVAIVGNPQMEDIAALTPEWYTGAGGATVNYVTLEEQTLREIVTVDVAVGGEFDAVMIGPFEAPQFGQNGWLTGLNDIVDSDVHYDSGDILPAVRGALSADGELYAVPFYAESSFIMYNLEIMEANGITMPAAPTWNEIADIARQVNTDDVAGICLRGLPGWGDFGASLTTVVNTFGGTWWEANADGSIGEAQINGADSGFRSAFEFYVSLLEDAGQPEPNASSFPQCLEQIQNGDVAMWFDATVAAGILEGDDSPLAGNLGTTLAPVGDTGLGGGWLWSWALAIPANASNPEAAAEYIKWATSPEYIQIVGVEGPGGWPAIPPGTRTSTYEIPEYIAASESFGQQTLDAINAANPDMPGLTQRPGLPGVQYVGVPEFQDVGTACTTELAEVLAGNATIDEGLDACQEIASAVSN